MTPSDEAARRRAGHDIDVVPGEPGHRAPGGRSARKSRTEAPCPRIAATCDDHRRQRLRRRRDASAACSSTRTSRSSGSPRSTSSASRSRRRTRTSTGSPDLVFEKIPPAEAAAGMRRRPPRACRTRSARPRCRSSSSVGARSSTCRATSACATPPSTSTSTARCTRCPSSLRHVRLRPARAQPRGASARRRYVASPGCFATAIALGLSRSRARACSRAGPHRARSPARPAAAPRRSPAPTTRCARSNLTTYKPLVHQHIAGDRADAARRRRARCRVPLRSCRSRRRSPRHLRHQLRRAGRRAATTSESPRSTTTLRATSRSSASGEVGCPRSSPVSRLNYVEVGFALGDAVGRQRARSRVVLRASTTWSRAAPARPSSR